MSGFETDLRLTREARSRTLEQIQQETRIPIHVLKRFEEGDLVTDPTFNRIYLVAFLRSYARAIGLPQADVVAGYEHSVAGTYRGELHPDYDGPPPAPAAPPAPTAGALGEPAPVSAPPPNALRRTPAASPAAASEPEPAGAPAADAPPLPATPVDALRAVPVAATAAAPAAAAMRVSRPGVPGARRSYDKNWGAILSLFAVVVVAIAVAVYFLFFRPDAVAPEGVADAAGVAARIDSAGVGAGAASGTRQLQVPIEVRVTAQNNGLQSFRVAVDAGGRKPFWINAGGSQTFTADSALVFSGEGSTAAFSDAILEWQGLRWTPADGQEIAITAANGQRMLDSLSTTLTSAAPAP